jgi:hypothetical protein
MRAVQSAMPDSGLLESLRSYQSEVDQAPDYADKVVRAQELWKARGNNPVLRRVRSLLRGMCSEEQCMYCERSVGNQLEHFRPRALYPEAVFSWANYLFICNPCNRIKSDHFAVFSSASGTRVDLLRKRDEPVREPEQGTPLLINPREEDPLDFLLIDFRETGHFLPRAAEGTNEWIRAEYTATELLDLNSASHRRSRRNAFYNFTLTLREYVRARDAGEPTNRCIEVITQSGHPGVWAAMKRDRETIPELQMLFESVPEALNW